MDMGFLSNWGSELEAMNQVRRGAKFGHPDTFIRPLAVLHAYFLHYRRLEGFIRALTTYVEGLKAPDYTTIRRWASRMKVELDSPIKAR